MMGLKEASELVLGTTGTIGGYPHSAVEEPLVRGRVPVGGIEGDDFQADEARRKDDARGRQQPGEDPAFVFTARDELG